MSRYMRRSSDEHYEASLIWYENHGQLNDNHCVKNVRIWSFLAHIRTKNEMISVQMRENTDQENSQYGHFSRSE